MPPFNRLITSLARVQRPVGSRPRLALALAVAIAVVAPVVAWAGGFIAVTSLTVSPIDVTSGGTSTGTVTLDALPAKGSVTVQLASANPQVATVPSSVSFSSTSLVKSTSKTFSVQSVSGASGCSRISAQLGTAPAKRAVLFVRPVASSSSLKLILSKPTVVGGGSLTGTVQYYAPGGTLPGGTLVQLISSNTAVASVPDHANLTVRFDEAGGAIGEASFPITTTVTDVETCAVISATYAGTTTKVLLKVATISG